MTDRHDDRQTQEHTQEPRDSKTCLDDLRGDDSSRCLRQHLIVNLSSALLQMKALILPVLWWRVENAVMLAGRRDTREEGNGAVEHTTTHLNANVP